MKIVVPFLDSLHEVIDKGHKYMSVADKDCVYQCSSNHFAKEMGLKRKEIEGRNFYNVPVPAQELANKFISECNATMESRNNNIYFCSSKFANNEHKSFIYNMIPILNAKNVSLGTFCIAREMDNNNDIIQAVNDLNDVANVFSFNKQLLVKSTYPGLSKRESECLFWLLRGKTASKIAVRLNVSIRTVETHLENVKNKFKCSTRSEVFDTAVDMGLLNILPVLRVEVG